MILNALKKAVKSKELEQELHALQEEINKLKNKKQEIENIIDNRSQHLNRLNSQLHTKEAIILSEDLGISYEPSGYNISELEENINQAKTEIAKNLKDNKYVTLSRKYTVDNSTVKGERFVKSFCENNILGFNLYCEKKLKTLTEQNFYHTMELIEKKFNQFSNKINIIGGSFNACYLDLVKTWMQTELDLKIAKKQEQERIREEKRKLREEQQLLIEAEKERKRLEEERKAMDLAYNRALSESERKEIKKHLEELDKRIADVDYRVANPKAGWVYIIHSDSLKNMVKIGTSRRLTGPHERVKELSGSSLPTPFMIDAFCFSDNAFELESNLHKYFDKQRINPNKEFFRITAQEAINAMENVFNHKAHIIKLEDNDSEID